MTLKVRKIIVVGVIAAIFMAGNILVIANWIRENFLTGTAIAVIIALLILLVNPGKIDGDIGQRRCPICDKKMPGNPNYSGECG
jgi:hypothetical protein